MNKNTFVCPGMVVKMPYQLANAQAYTYCLVLQVFRDSVDMKNLITGNIYPLGISSLRERGELIGYNYKVKV